MITRDITPGRPVLAASISVTKKITHCQCAGSIYGSNPHFTRFFNAQSNPSTYWIQELQKITPAIITILSLPDLF